MVTLGVEIEDAAAEQPELDPELDHHAEVAVGEGLDDGDEAADVVLATAGARVAHRPEAFGGQPVAPSEGLLAVLFARQVRRAPELRLAQQPPQALADLALVAVEVALQRRDVERRLDLRRELGRAPGGEHLAGRFGTGDSEGAFDL